MTSEQLDSSTDGLSARDRQDGSDVSPDTSPAQLHEVARKHYVVGIGASAGGLEAIERFFDHVPVDSGLSFILVQHLSPDFRSLMDELLPRHTEIAVHRVQDGMPIEPNAIYLIPSKKNMVVSDGRLHLTDKDQSAGLNLPIDIFLRSLARDVGERAIAVILSGTGSDGSRGVKEVHEAGGLVIVQDPETASFDGMPRAALATGVADSTLAPEEIPSRILKYIDHPGRDTSNDDAVLELPSNDLEKLLSLLRRTYGVDFTLYKPGTISRRLERRMNLANVDSIGDYLAYLESRSQELDTLYRDLLVEVTQFFRDPEAFNVLREEVIPAICDQPSSDDGIRVWVPGCATGEEAYSLAMLFHECAQGRPGPLDIKIFATDVHRASLDIASNGIYSEQSISDLPASYVNRYFLHRREKYHVTQALRQLVIFAPHNLTKDPPFTKLDLISCRNVLIYLNAQTQKKILSLFHFGLKTGGTLSLGPSESVTELEHEFETIDSHWKIFRKRRDVRLPNVIRQAINPLSDTSLQVRERLSSAARSEPRLPDLYEALLHRFVPPSLLIDERRELVHTFGEARKYLQVPEGKATNDVLRMVDDGLRMALSAALHRATKDSGQVVYGGVRVHRDGEECSLKLTVLPVPDKRSRSVLYLVSLEEEVEAPSPRADSKTFNYENESAQHIRQLERDLTYSKEHLQSTIEELETSNEELQSTNEELVASNEELQSTNEELHSVNEELYTVNAEHQRKIDELTQLTNDMDNLLESTEIGTLFLDKDLNVRKFTPAIGRIFNLLPQDIGRPLRHISTNITIDYETLNGRIEQTLTTGRAIHQELPGPRGEIYLLRVLPYRTHHQVITGVVLTFVDITATKETERQFQLNERRLTLALEAGNICTWTWNLESKKFSAGPGFATFFGIEPEGFDSTFEGMIGLLHEDDRTRFRGAVKRVLAEDDRLEIDCRAPMPDGAMRYVTIRADLDRNAEHQPIRMVGVLIDVSDRRQMQTALQESQQLLKAILDNSSSGIFARDLEGRYLFANRSFLELHGLADQNVLGKTDYELFPRDVAEAMRANDEAIVASGQVDQAETTAALPSGLHHFLSVKFPLRGAESSITGVGGISTDITALKRAETEVREALDRRDHFLAMLSHELRNPLGAILHAVFVLQAESADPASILDAQEVIQRQARQMARLLDDLLDVSRIAQNKIELRNEVVLLGSILQEAIAVTGPLFSAGQLSLSTQVSDEALHVLGDEARLQQTLVNLLTNAAKYTPAFGKVHVGLGREDNKAVIRVQDTGVGIAADMLHRIFDIFVQGHDTLDRSGGGIGVGLTLVRNIVELHGGSVVARSPGINQGSEFVVHLPLASSKSAVRRTENEPVHGPVAPLRIAVIEDNPDSRRMLETLLSLEGYEVRVAGDGRGGLELIQDFRPDIAFVDVGLPVLDGFQVAARVRENFGDRDVYLVALTGYGRPEDRRAVLDAGFDEHLVKPPRREALTEIFARVCKRREERKAV